MNDETKVTEINKDKSKDPKSFALNKIREAASQEINKKIEAQVKKTLDAIKIATAEKKALSELIEESEEAKAEFSSLIKEI